MVSDVIVRIIFQNKKSTEVYSFEWFDIMGRWKKDLLGSPKLIRYPCTHIQTYYFPSYYLFGTTVPGTSSILRDYWVFFAKDLINIILLVLLSVRFFEDHQGCLMSRIHRLGLPRRWINLLPWDNFRSIHGVSLPISLIGDRIVRGKKNSDD